MTGNADNPRYVTYARGAPVRWPGRRFPHPADAEHVALQRRDHRRGHDEERNERDRHAPRRRQRREHAVARERAEHDARDPSHHSPHGCSHGERVRGDAHGNRHSHDSRARALCFATAATVVPIALAYCPTRLALDDDRDWVLERMRSACDRFGNGRPPA